MAQIEIYTTRICPFCIAAKKLLGEKQVSYDEIDVGGNDGHRDKLHQTGWCSKKRKLERHCQPLRNKALSLQESGLAVKTCLYPAIISSPAGFFAPDR